jgi:hypothetical protein
VVKEDDYHDYQKSSFNSHDMESQSEFGSQKDGNFHHKKDSESYTKNRYFKKENPNG